MSLQEKASFSQVLLELNPEECHEYRGYGISDDERGFTSEEEVDRFLEDVVGQLRWL